MGMSVFAGHKNEKWLVALDEQYMELEKQKPRFEEARACPEARSKWIELMGRQQEISARILPLLGVFEVDRRRQSGRRMKSVSRTLHAGVTVNNLVKSKAVSLA